METDNMPSTSKAGMDDDDDKDVVQQYINSSGVVLDREEFMESCEHDSGKREIGSSSDGQLENDVPLKISTLKSDEVLINVEEMDNSIEDQSYHIESHNSGKTDKQSTHFESFHAKDAGFRCQLCEFSSPDQTELQRHSKNAHMVVKNYESVYCDFLTSLNKHSQTVYPYEVDENFDVVVNDKNDKCIYCEFITDDQCSLESHIIAVHVGDKKYKCEHCDFSSCKRSSLTKHINTNFHCKDKNLNKLASSSSYRNEETNMDNKLFKCEHCQYTTPFSAKIKRHTKAVHEGDHKFKCEHCDYSDVILRNLKRHIKSVHVKDKKCQCKHCNFSCVHYSNLKKHIESVHTDLHKCKHCDFSSCKLSSLTKHINTTFHGKDKNLNKQPSSSSHRKEVTNMKNKLVKCEHCDYMTPYSNEVKRHTKAVHEVDYKYKCEHCEYSGVSLRNLKRHLNGVHVKDKKCQCKHCNFSCVHYSNLKKHIESVHTNLYKCEHCDFSSCKMAKLSNHINSTSHGRDKKLNMIPSSSSHR